MKTMYVLTMMTTGQLIRDQFGHIMVFNSAPSTALSTKYSILAISSEEINEIIYNENLNKDGI
jgi:hypothetical protein